jgi:hypothetical protein
MFFELGSDGFFCGSGIRYEAFYFAGKADVELFYEEYSPNVFMPHLASLGHTCAGAYRTRLNDGSYDVGITAVSVNGAAPVLLGNKWVTGANDNGTIVCATLDYGPTQMELTNVLTGGGGLTQLLSPVFRQQVRFATAGRGFGRINNQGDVVVSAQVLVGPDATATWEEAISTK